MNDTVARMTAAFSAVLLAAALAALYIGSNPGAGDTEVAAEFDDVYPLLPGMHVRVDGAIAGSVGEIEVADTGRVLVRMNLNEGTAPPRADASAAVRQQDITGDSYVALEPGEDEEPLGDAVIDHRRTLVAPRFDDLLDSFNEPVRQGVELILVELGKGLERRGADLNRAVFELRPGLEAANEALAEVRSQNAVLRGLIADAESVTAQTASRRRELGSLIDSLSTTLQVTANRRPQLDAALERLPASAGRAERTLGKLADVAIAARPLARTIADGAPEIETTLRRLGPFLDDAEVTMDAVGPTLVLIDRLLTASLPTLREAPSRVLTAPLDIAAAAGAVLDSLLGERELQRALFSADGYGTGEKAADDVGLGAVGVERGDQAGYEGNDPERRFLRAETVLTCETFGIPIRPGCLLEAIAGGGPHRGGEGSPGGGGGDGRGAGAPAAPGGGGDGSGQGAAGGLGDALGETLGDVNDALEQGGEGADLGAVEGLLDFLTR